MRGYLCAAFVFACLFAGPFPGIARESEPKPASTPPQEPEEIVGQYTPGAGFRVAKTELGELNIRVFTYLRCLNQSGLDPTYTNAFGRTSNVQQREDLQLNKVQITTFDSFGMILAGLGCMLSRRSICAGTNEHRRAQSLGPG